MSATHFVTALTFHRKRLFQNERFGDLLTEVLMRWRQERSIALHDYVIMPDHLHVLFTGPEKANSADLFAEMQRCFASELGSQFGYNGEVWESHFRDRAVESAEDTASCVKMIHSNPVRVGFCETPGEYRMSSKASRWVLDPLPKQLRDAELEHA
jgi:putative transposase